MENRKRNIQMKFYVTEEEKRLIDEKTYQFLCFALSIKARSKPCVLKHFKGALDAGAVLGAVVLDPLRRLFGQNGLLIVAALGFAAATTVLALVQHVAVVLAAMAVYAWFTAQKVRPSRDVIFEMVEECIEATERMNNLMNQTAEA